MPLEHDHPPFPIKSQHSPWRDLVPIYSSHQFRWNVAVVIGIYAALFWLDPTFAPVGTFTGYFVGALVQRSGRPACMSVPAALSRTVEAALARSGWREVPDGESWGPPLPAWLQWDHSTIHLKRKGEELLIGGPANVLRRLRDLTA